MGSTRSLLPISLLTYSLRKGPSSKPVTPTPLASSTRTVQRLGGFSSPGAPSGSTVRSAGVTVIVSGFRGGSSPFEADAGMERIPTFRTIPAPSHVASAISARTQTASPFRVRSRFMSGFPQANTAARIHADGSRPSGAAHSLQQS